MVSAKLGQNVTLACSTPGSEPAPEFTWFKDGKDDPGNVLPPDNKNLNIERTTPTESQLVFTNITVTNAGTYHCKANNTFMEDIKSVIVNVECELVVL